MTRQIIDNFLDPKDFRLLKDAIFSPAVSWSYTHVVVPEYQALCQGKYNFQLYHPFYTAPYFVSNTCKILEPLLKKLNPSAIIKIKANLVPCTDTVQAHGYHVDVEDKVINHCKTAVFYINTNNGYTMFESDSEQVESVENRILIFDAVEPHTGSTCTDQKCRIVININYIP